MHNSFLQWSPSGTTFISIGMLTRSIEGLGVAAFFTSCWTIVCLDFPEHISRLFVSFLKVYFQIINRSIYKIGNN